MDIRSYKFLEFFRTCPCERQIAHPPRSALGELHVHVMRVSQVLHKPLACPWAHRLNADLDPAGVAPGPFLHTLGPEGEAPVIEIPDRERQRCESLEILPAEVLLAVTEVDGIAQFRQFRERMDIREHGALSVGGPAAREVPEHLDLPVKVRRLLRTVPHAEACASVLPPYWSG